LLAAGVGGGRNKEETTRSMPVLTEMDTTPETSKHTMCLVSAWEQTRVSTHMDIHTERGCQTRCWSKGKEREHAAASGGKPSTGGCLPGCLAAWTVTLHLPGLPRGRVYRILGFQNSLHTSSCPNCLFYLQEWSSKVS
jgi:hypothetical protein